MVFVFVFVFLASATVFLQSASVCCPEREEMRLFGLCVCALIVCVRRTAEERNRPTAIIFEFTNARSPYLHEKSWKGFQSMAPGAKKKQEFFGGCGKKNPSLGQGKKITLGKTFGLGRIFVFVFRTRALRGSTAQREGKKGHGPERGLKVGEPRIKLSLKSAPTPPEQASRANPRPPAAQVFFQVFSASCRTPRRPPTRP